MCAARYICFTNDGFYARKDDGFDQLNVRRIADAVAAYWCDQAAGATVYVGYDTRAEAKAMAQIAARVLSSWGLVVQLSDGYCPMPALNNATRHDASAIGALMFTADHRSADYLGVRIRNADSSAITAEQADLIESLVPQTPSEPAGSYELVDFVSPYMRSAARSVDARLIASAHLACVLDPMYGTARGYAAHLFEALGVAVQAIHQNECDDFCGLHPEVVEPWLDDCEQTVQESAVDIGIAIDGPANRAVAIDERGWLVPTPKLYALILEHLVQDRGMTGRVVVPRTTSTIVRRQAARLGLPLTVVADAPHWAFEEIRQGDVLIAGDGLGGLCVPAFDPERNAFVTALLLLETLAAQRKPLSQLVRELDGELGKMEYGHRDLRLDAGAYQVVRNLLPGINAAGVFSTEPVAVSHADGVRVQFADDSWVLMRPSQTESLIRVYAEGPTHESKDILLNGAVTLIGSALKTL